jgi:hypothetical protein
MATNLRRKTGTYFNKFLGVILTLGLGVEAWSQSWTPDSATIAKLESSIHEGDIPRWGSSTRYPSGHSPRVTEYARYSAGDIVDGQKVVLGEFVIPEGSKEKPPGIYIVQSKKGIPMIFDGGCGVVHVVYAVEAGRILSLRCNGLA